MYARKKAIPMTQSYTPNTTSARLSPFRYPGGKASIYGHLRHCINTLESTSVCYVEPYAGGAGSALMLLRDNAVKEIHLNDADICVYGAWHSILYNADEFIHLIETTPINMETWYSSKAILDKSSKEVDLLTLGFATFFLNRTNRSGILRGAGPIGGYEQSGNWKIDARYYKNTIIKRINDLKKIADRVHLHNKDGLNFLRWASSNIPASDLFAFIDPPYVQAGSRLYLNTMNTQKHEELADFLNSGRLQNWVLTYDDCDLIRKLYSDSVLGEIEINYSLQNKRRETEVIITRLANG